MQFHVSKIVSALILLNTTICLAMKKSGGNNLFKIGIASATCENRVYSKEQIFMAIVNGLQSISEMEESNVNLDAVQYRPRPMEGMPSNDKFYFSELQRLGPNGPTDLVVFLRNGQFAKVVTRVLDSQGFKYIDCVPSQTTKFPQEYQPNLGISGQNSGVHDPFGIGTTSVSCDGRIYNRRQISIALINGMQMLGHINQLQMDPNLLQYKPKPTEVMPSQDKFYFLELNKARSNEPLDLVVFLSSGQFVKVVSLIGDGDDSVRIDCVSSSNRQSPERVPSRTESPEHRRIRMRFPVLGSLGVESPEQPRVRVKFTGRNSND